MREHLNLRRRLEDLVILADWVAGYVDRHALDPATAFRLELVLTEAVTNVIDHCVDATAIEIACTRDGEKVQVEIADDGAPFDPSALAPHALPTHLAEATPGGLGVHLIRQYSEDLRYQRTPGHNHLLLSLRVPA
jgi:anti-sigma regulatory factor (Ser/Thr protein kinase)